jgi:hypothetical protein
VGVGFVFVLRILYCVMCVFTPVFENYNK